MVYEYDTENTSRIEEIGKRCTERSEKGWEFVQLAAGGSIGSGGSRWVLLFRRPKQQ